MIIKNKGRLMEIKPIPLNELHSWHKLPDKVKRQLIRKDLFEHSQKHKEDELFFNKLKSSNDGKKRK